MISVLELLTFCPFLQQSDKMLGAMMNIWQNDFVSYGLEYPHCG